MKKADLIYKDQEYEIYKKDVGELGTYLPGDLLTLTHIGLTGLQEWANAGFKYKKDWLYISNGIKECLDEITNDFKE